MIGFRSSENCKKNNMYNDTHDTKKCDSPFSYENSLRIQMGSERGAELQIGVTIVCH